MPALDTSAASPGPAPGVEIGAAHAFRLKRRLRASCRLHGNRWRSGKSVIFPAY
jgi:hypothetical protein